MFDYQPTNRAFFAPLILLPSYVGKGAIANHQRRRFRESPVRSGTKKLRHPVVGPADYCHVVLQVADHPEQTLVTYSVAT